MTPEEFVKCFVREKLFMLEAWSGPEATFVGAQIDKMGLTPSQRQQLTGVLDAALTDALYTILLGLDGEATIGGVQVCYQVLDEAGSPLTGSGEIESEAYKQFHGESQ